VLIFSLALEAVESLAMRGYKLSVSAARPGTLVPDMFYNFYLVKNHKVANNSTNTKAREKISTFLESLEF